MINIIYLLLNQGLAVNPPAGVTSVASQATWAGDFSGNYIVGSQGSPITGDIIAPVGAGAVEGSQVLIIHNDTVEPDIATGYYVTGAYNYAPGANNSLLITFLGGFPLVQWKAFAASDLTEVGQSNGLAVSQESSLANWGGDFSQNYTVGTIAAPVTGNIPSFDSSDDVNGAIVTIFHQEKTEPTFPAEYVKDSGFVYIPSVLNVIQIENINGVPTVLCEQFFPTA